MLNFANSESVESIANMLTPENMGHCLQPVNLPWFQFFNYVQAYIVHTSAGLRAKRAQTSNLKRETNSSKCDTIQLSS